MVAYIREVRIKEANRRKKALKIEKIKQECIISAKKFNTKTEWLVGDSKGYHAAKRYRIYKECIKHMPHQAPHGKKRKTRQTKETCETSQADQTEKSCES